MDQNNLSKLLNYFFSFNRNSKLIGYSFFYQLNELQKLFEIIFCSLKLGNNRDRQKMPSGHLVIYMCKTYQCSNIFIMKAVNICTGILMKGTKNLIAKIFESLTLIYRSEKCCPLNSLGHSFVIFRK